jgi:hypothetical protein
MKQEEKSVLKILLKTVALVATILLVYFLVQPWACSNLLQGRVTIIGTPEKELPASQHNELFVPAGDPPLNSTDTATQSRVQGITDTNTLTAQEGETEYTQAEIDEAIARRYVELENQYADQHKTGKDVAKEISYIVMDDFELTPQEWEAFLERATADNLFNKIRTEVAAKK